jgi:hypothetical protein
VVAEAVVKVVKVTKVAVANREVRVVKEVVTNKAKAGVKRLSTTGWGAGEPTE